MVSWATSANSKPPSVPSIIALNPTETESSS